MIIDVDANAIECRGRQQVEIVSRRIHEIGRRRARQIDATRPRIRSLIVGVVLRAR